MTLSDQTTQVNTVNNSDIVTNTMEESKPPKQLASPKEIPTAHENTSDTVLFISEVSEEPSVEKTSPDDSLPTDNLPTDSMTEAVKHDDIHSVDSIALILEGPDELEPCESVADENTVLVNNTTTQQQKYRQATTQQQTPVLVDQEGHPNIPRTTKANFVLKTAKKLVRTISSSLSSKAEIMHSLKEMVDSLKFIDKDAAAERVMLFFEAGVALALVSLVQKYYNKEQFPEKDLYFWTCGAIHFMVKYDTRNVMGPKICQLGVVTPLQQALAVKHLELESGGATLQVLAQIVKTVGVYEYFNARDCSLFAIFSMQLHPQEQIVCHPAVVLLRHMLKHEESSTITALRLHKGYTLISTVMDQFADDRVIMYCGRKILATLVDNIIVD